LLGDVLGDNIGATPIVGVAGALSALAGATAILAARVDMARWARDGVLALPQANAEQRMNAYLRARVYCRLLIGERYDLEAANESARRIWSGVRG